jgi:serine/threonine protein phosphatase 1
MKRYAISDIHGNFRAFEKLLDHVDPDPEELVVCGDLGDRGLDTWGVYKECSMLLDEGATILSGNHEIYFAQYKNHKISEMDFFSAAVGGKTTVESLKVARKKHGDDEVNEVVGGLFKRMEMYYEDENFIFVHAGIDPRIPYMDQQKNEVLLEGTPAWRDPNLSHTFEQFVVFGHTPTPSIHKAITEDDARVWTSNRAKKIAIDTGAGFGMRLTMVDLIEGIAYAYDFAKRDIIEYQFRRRMRLRG